MPRLSRDRNYFQLPRRIAGVLTTLAILVVALPSAAQGLTATTSQTGSAGPEATPTATGLPTQATALSNCPWLASAVAQHETSSALAALVVARMTLAEKLGGLVLYSSGSYENVNSGVARLCVPSLTLQDGPAGLAFGDTGVTQLPAPLGIAATFDTALARRWRGVTARSKEKRLGARASTSSKGRT